MRELILNPEESSRTSLVFTAKDGDEQFYLVVDDSLRATLLGEDAESAQSEDAAQTESESADSSGAQDGDTAEPEREERTQKEVDPRLSTPLKMTPREIQQRVRAGATTEELAEENDVTPSRIEPYAHPVLLERARMAELGKKSHPVRDDGPAKLTLWEILATAFAARGLELSTATWDSYRDEAGQWVVTVSWNTGMSENVAEWSFMRQGMSKATTVARNAIAADLVDPDFAQPVRTLGSVSPIAEREPQDEEQDVQEVEGEEFLQHPEPVKPASARRRKAVTPHWEDVLLGVRTNTKRPRS